jgi:superfamily I DNA and/or RNA helicase
MSQKDIWKLYITAQSKILEYRSRPIGIDTLKEVRLDGVKLKVAVDQDLFKRAFRQDVEQLFKISNFNFSDGHILAKIENTANITPEALLQLKETAENYYINFNENPIIEGEITARHTRSLEHLKNVISELPTSYQFKNDGLIYLTINEWKEALKIKQLQFNKKAGAVFPINPSVSYLISTFYKHIDISQKGPRVRVTGELHQDVFDLFQKHVGLTVNENCLIFTFQNAEALQRKVKEFEQTGRSFPQPIHNELHFHLKTDFYKTYDSNLAIEAFRLKRLLTDSFPDNPFSFYYTTDYSYDIKLLNDGLDELGRSEEAYWNQLFSTVHGNEFQISSAHRTISFDFETEEELQSKLDHLKSYPFFTIYNRGDKHKFKFNIKFETGLHQLQASLKKNCRGLFTKLIANGEKLVFRQFYKTGNKTEILARLRNQLDECIDPQKFHYDTKDSFLEKYLCEENFELKVEQEEEKLSKLLREDFLFGDRENKFYLGKLQKVDYPDLYFIIDEEKLDEVKRNLASKQLLAIFPDLKGEKDKIKRLEDTVRKLDSTSDIPNNNAREFLYDSSKAKPTEDIGYLLNRMTAEWEDFESNLLSRSLNESQKEAIYKALYAEELALIQGPPGTGKSTAIAEIVWHHIRYGQQQRILLTSETNLAVDNAIIRLKNNQNNLVKPVRFGNDEKLESEGHFYSLSAIKNWKEGDDTQDNTVAHWIANISNRIVPQNEEVIDTALDKWKKWLQQPNPATRQLFADRYLEYANLIGATGSSIGKMNSENKWTSFFRSYLNVFNWKAYENKDRRRCNAMEIQFDTVIMDEASKATPTELALPVLYAKKSIIVGDHRQLPPIIDGEEIKDVLYSIGEKKLAARLSQQEFAVSQFERLFEKIDDSIKGTFNTQYRMHPAINDVIAQFYKKDGGLFCGLPQEEAEHNSFDKWNSRYHGLHYKNIITRETHTIWIDVNTPEIQEATSRVNFGEIDAIHNILTVLNNCQGKKEFDQWLATQSPEEKQIGIISFYGKQIQYINRMLKEHHPNLHPRLSTVDRFQGMERNIIIVSMVRSNTIASFRDQQPDELYGRAGYPLQESLGFAESPNRLNVALSRARRLLIIVGNSAHFCRKDIYKNVYQSILNSSRGKVINAEDLQKAVAQNG